MSPPFDWWPPDGPWPSTPGGIRGPDGRTLTDLYNQLTTILVAVGGLNDTIAAGNALLSEIGQSLERLIGLPGSEPVGWAGLAAYLDTRVAALSGGSYSPALPRPSLLAMANLFLELETAGQSGDRSYTALLQTLFGPGTYYQNAAATTGTDLPAVRAVLGELAHAPVGSTIKDLLRSVDTNVLRTAECCEDNAPPPGGGDNPPPEESMCEDNGTAGMIRVVSLLPITEGQPGFTPGSTHIWLDFGNADGTVLSYDGFASGEAGAPVYLVDYGGDLSGCIEWDLTDNNAPPWTVQTVLIEQVGGVWSQSYSTDLGTAFANGHNGTGWTRADGVRFAFRLEYTGGEGEPAPGRNFWLSYGPSPA